MLQESRGDDINVVEGPGADLVMANLLISDGGVGAIIRNTVKNEISCR